ncbi:hypothetical protein KAR48_14120 [bacterium]|nr:hypothetical protein [bacterium]
MTYEYKLKDTSAYFRNYLKTLGVILPTFFLLIIQLVTRVKMFGNMVFFAAGGLIIILIAVIAAQYYRDKDKRYILTIHSIQVMRQYQMSSHLFSELVKIKRSAQGASNWIKMDSLELIFRDGRKIKLVSYLPFYHEFRKTLAQLLADGRYYEQIEMKRPLL